MRVLLIEDDLFFEKFYAVKLQENQLDVDTAVDGQDGLEKMRKVRPDLILLDLIMPRLDGFGVLSAMAQDPNLKTIPVIVFSTLGQDQDVAKAKQLGAVDYMNKSFFDFQGLLSKVKSYDKKA